MTARIELPALIGSHPLGALASFGLLRLVSEWDGDARLHFTLKDDWIAAIESARFDSMQALVEALDEWSRSTLLDELLGWADDVRVEPHEYGGLIARALSEGNLPLIHLLGALVAEGAVDAQKGLVKPSALYMVSGQQSFLGGMREILLRVREAGRDAFEEALAGPWRYTARSHSLGWDPNTERLYALRHRAPTSEKPSCVAAAVLLGFWALPLFPTLSNACRPVTIGFSRTRADHYFSWPVFDELIELAELRTLLHAGSNHWLGGKQRFRAGIAAVYESSRAEFGQGYAILRASRVVRPQHQHQPRRQGGGASRR